MQPDGSFAMTCPVCTSQCAFSFVCGQSQAALSKATARTLERTAGAMAGAITDPMARGAQLGAFLNALTSAPSGTKRDAAMSALAEVVGAPVSVGAAAAAGVQGLEALQAGRMQKRRLHNAEPLVPEATAVVPPPVPEASVYPVFDDDTAVTDQTSDEGAIDFDFTNDPSDVVSRARDNSAVCAYCGTQAAVGHCCGTMQAFVQSGRASADSFPSVQTLPQVTPGPHVAPLPVRGLKVLFKFLLEMSSQLRDDQVVKVKKLRQMVMMQIKDSPDLTENMALVVAEAVREFDDVLDILECRSADDLPEVARRGCLWDLIEYV